MVQVHEIESGFSKESWPAPAWCCQRRCVRVLRFAQKDKFCTVFPRRVAQAPSRLLSALRPFLCHFATPLSFRAKREISLLGFIGLGGKERSRTTTSPSGLSAPGRLSVALGMTNSTVVISSEARFLAFRLYRFGGKREIPNHNQPFGLSDYARDDTKER